MDFTYNTTHTDVGVYSLRGNLIGEHDGISLTESVSEQIENGIRHFIIDLKDLQHINSTGLGVLITILTKSRKVGGDVVLSNPSSYISNLLIITKLNTIFSIHKSVEQAMADYID